MKDALVRDYKKFFTYPETAAFMARLLSPKAGDKILEPSCGSGNLCKAVKDIESRTIIYGVEIQEQWKDNVDGVDNLYIGDFLDGLVQSNFFDSCIANPPFGNGVDLQAHINKMYWSVKVGGKLVILVPADYEFQFPCFSIPLENWSKNSNGTITPIKLLLIVKS